MLKEVVLKNMLTANFPFCTIEPNIGIITVCLMFVNFPFH